MRVEGNERLLMCRDLQNAKTTETHSWEGTAVGVPLPGQRGNDLGIAPVPGT
jgi:hypothetical protein